MATLPEGFEELRPHQVVAIDEAVRMFTEDDMDVVFLEAPTGSGKTLIGEMIRRELNVSGLYVCSDKSLQDQFARDFKYAKVLKGRANYPTQSNPDATAADCTAQTFDDDCWHCDGGKACCPYEIAKAAAKRAELAVTNTSYLLTEANYVGNFSGRDLVIVDEGDTLERILMGFVEYRAPRRLVEELQMPWPVKGARKKTLMNWLIEFADELVKLQARTPRVSIEGYKKWMAIRSAIGDARRVAEELRRDIELREADSEDNGVWLRDYEKVRGETHLDLILKPVVVNNHGSKNLWRHGRKWLIMSATIISADEMADSLGLPLDYGTISVPSTFPKENRPIILAPVANVIYKEMDKAREDLAFAIMTAANKHPGDRIIVHTVSYSLARELEERLRSGQYAVNRPLITYTEGRGREASLERFKRTKGAIMLAPSITRGIDLPDDLCRVQIIAKCPFPALGDKQVSSRVHLPGGQMWYTVQTIRDIVQMTGRGVRHKDDWCVTYIFDQQFSRNLWSKWKRLFPAWWSESVQTGVDVREFIRR